LEHARKLKVAKPKKEEEKGRKKPAQKVKGRHTKGGGGLKYQPGGRSEERAPGVGQAA